jgi:hypothetical protein
LRLSLLALRLAFSGSLLRPLLSWLPAVLAKPLLPLLNLLLEVAAGLVVVACPGLVEAAIGTAYPAFRICLPALRAEDTFWQRHGRIGAHCTLPCVPGSDEERRLKTLRTLIEIADETSPTLCWDDQRAADLLRSQSSPQELRTLGASEDLIRHIFGEGHGR